jgi:type I restriction enzyme R subunit
VDIDAAYDIAEAAAGGAPSDGQVTAARRERMEEAVKVLAANPKLRTRILEIRTSYRQVIDAVSTDSIVGADFSTSATARAKQTITDWKAFIEENRDELDALQILYSKPAGKRLTFAEIRELANAISRPPHLWTPERLWGAYETLEKPRVRRHGGSVLTDLVSLVRFAIEDEDELVPWSDTINQRFDDWLRGQNAQGVTFNYMQMQWLGLIKDQIAGSLAVSFDDLMDAPFSQHGGLAKARQVFGDELDALLEDLTAVLVA